MKKRKTKKRPAPVPGRKPGRPSGTTIPPENLQVRRAIRYTDAEWRQIADAAKLNGSTASDLIRRASIAAAEKIVRRQSR